MNRFHNLWLRFYTHLYCGCSTLFFLINEFSLKNSKKSVEVRFLITERLQKTWWVFAKRAKLQSTFLDNDNTYDSLDSKHSIQNKNSESTERRKIVFQKNGYKMQTYIDPFKENNDLTRLIRTVLFRGSFNFFFFLIPLP